MAVATGKNAFDSSILLTDVVNQDDSKKSFTIKLMAGIGMSVLVLSALTIGNRVVFDGKLRKDVQTVLLNQGTKDTLVSIESSAIRLASEPEYIIQALRPLAEIGDARKLDAISEATYHYYPLSIQARLIRADVLRALGDDREACSLRETLLLNTPWDFNQLQSFVTCYSQGFQYEDYRMSLILIEKYIPVVDESVIPSNADEMLNLNSRLIRVSVYANVYLTLGNMEKAISLQSYGLRLFDRLEELLAAGATGPSLNEITLYKKLLDF